MREIKGEAITQAVARLCMSANRNLPQDVRTCITQSQERESWEPARGILSKIVENYKIAEEDQLPICQDTGVACVFLEVGQEVHIQGDLEQAADSVGINVYKMRYAGVMISGFLGGIGGLAYVLVIGSSFSADVGGYGFLALAVMIFGNWKPLQIFFCSIFFALFKVVGTYYTLIPFLPNFKGVEKVSNIYNMLPYVVTMIVLIATSKSSQAPKAEGIPYDKGSR